MIDTSQAIIHTVSAHSIVKSDGQQELKWSDAPLDVNSDLLNAPLLLYFLSNFNTPEYYNFLFSDADPGLNPICTFSKQIFDDSTLLHANSIHMAKHLLAVSEHPNIKAGDLYVAHFSGIRIDGEVLEAIGIFKSENKETYLKLRTDSRRFSMDAEEGINVRKLDKGCLILNVQGEEGYKILIVDANKTDAQYWKQDFLNIKPCADAFHQTHNFMNLTRQYVGDQLDEEFSVSKADKIDLLNRSVNFFKSHEVFNQNEFETEVFEDASVIESFRKYERSLMADEGIADNFEISAQAVKRQARIFKSVLKLDKNFHVYIHGNRELIEKGFDETRNRHFYKIYFDQET